MFTLFSRKKIILAMTLTLMNSSLVAAASFNCKKAGTTVEKTICNDPKLSRADEVMAEAYNQLINSLPSADASKLKQEQREWLEFRNAECVAEDALGLLAVYEDRTAILNFRISSDFVASPATHISGRYAIGNHMFMNVQPMAKQRVFIEIGGAEPYKVSWVCNFSGSGELKQNVVKITHKSEGTPITFTFSDSDHTVEVNGNALDYFCGVGGTIGGKYKREEEKINGLNHVNY
jgi:uncharacterized protein